MYRLLIVDDEAIIADGLFEVFQNIQHLELDVYKAYSGVEAVQHFNRMRPDIVLTDIRMPGLDGLQLLEKIRERWPKCRVIFLTGYNEFSYIYSAIQYEGVSYLLKTEGYDKVINMVEHAVADIETELKAESLLKRAEEQLNATKELLQKDYFNGILKEQFDVHEINQQQFDELGIPLDAGLPVLMMLGRINSSSKGTSYSERSRQLYSIKLIAEQYFSTHVTFVHFLNENMDLIWLIQPLQGEGQANYSENWERILTFIKGNLELVQAACRESVGAVLSFVLDDSTVRWDKAADRFSTLNMLLNYRIGQGSGMLLLDKNIIEKDLQQLGGNHREKSQVRQFKLDTLADYLEHGQKDEFMKTLNHLTGSMEETDHMHNVQTQEFYYSISLILLSYMNRWNLVEGVAAKIGLHKLMQPGEHETWSSAIDYLVHVGQTLFNLQNLEEERRATTIINMIQKHIQEQLHNPDELSLVRLADLAYFNPSYLSRLFKQVAGLNLSDYIAAARMNKAKSLLENPNVKIQEVAEQVGYGTATNFTRSFRKFTHMTPQEYRASFLNK
jgi:two-component system response regulator YesN